MEVTISIEGCNECGYGKHHFHYKVHPKEHEEKYLPTIFTSQPFLDAEYAEVCAIQWCERRQFQVFDAIYL
jgi:hypothetical protein